MGPCSSVGTSPVAPGCWPGNPKLRMKRGLVGSLKSYTCVMRRIARRAWIGHVENRSTVELRCARKGVDRLGGLGGPPVMTNIQDPAAVLFAHQRLIGAARLQIVETNQRHILGFRRNAGCLR